MQVVNRLQKAHVQSIIKDFGPEYDKLWIFSKIHHEMNQLCSKSTLQDIYVDKFDQVCWSCIASATTCLLLARRCFLQSIPLLDEYDSHVMHCKTCR